MTEALEDVTIRQIEGLGMTVKTLGILGDIHQEDMRLEGALRHLRELGVDRILCTGDIVDGYGNPDRCIDLLRKHGVESVLGNHDRWFLSGIMRSLPDALPLGSLAQRNWMFLADLPGTRTYESPLGPLLLCHGMGEIDMAALGPDDEGYALEANADLQAILRSHYRVAVAGHTHQRMVRTIQGILFINPGSILRDYEPGFVRVDWEHRQVQGFSVDYQGTVGEAQHCWSLGCPYAGSGGSGAQSLRGS